MQRAKLLATAQLQQRLQLRNWATGGQLGSGTRFQMHFACVIKMSLIYGQAEPSQAQPGADAAGSKQQAERIARVSTLWLPLATARREKQNIFPSCGRRVNYNYGHEDRPNSRLTLRLRRQLDLKLRQKQRPWQTLLLQLKLPLPLPLLHLAASANQSAIC